MPEQYQTSSLAPLKKKQKHKKHKKSSEISIQETGAGIAGPGIGVVGEGGAGSGGESYEKKHKKQKRHEDEKDRKKKKKEKKKKKQKHSPEHPGASASIGTTNSNSNPPGMMPLLWETFLSRRFISNFPASFESINKIPFNEWIFVYYYSFVQIFSSKLEDHFESYSVGLPETMISTSRQLQSHNRLNDMISG